MASVPQKEAQRRGKTYLWEKYFSHIKNLLGSPRFLRQIRDIGSRWTFRIPEPV